MLALDLVFAFGILGNLIALIKLSFNSTKNNFTMLLNCLMTNNIIALTGVTILSTLHFHLSESLIEAYFRWFCISWVICRFFGVCSGCIAVFMSIDRYIAVGHTFFYQVNWTKNINRIAILGLTLLAAVITFLPFFGFGVYLDEDSKKCLRYREASSTSDRAYAYLFLAFGTLICILIVTFNALAIRALLYHMRQIQKSRYSPSLYLVDIPTTMTLPTIEIQFYKLMVMLDLSFIICWMPQMISTLFTLLNFLQKEHWFFTLAETLLGMHFTLDPYIYMLNRKNLQLFWDIIQCKCLCRFGTSSPNNSNPNEEPNEEPNTGYINHI